MTTGGADGNGSAHLPDFQLFGVRLTGPILVPLVKKFRFAELDGEGAVELFGYRLLLLKFGDPGS